MPNCILISDDDDRVGHIQACDDVDFLICLGDLYDVTIERAIDTYAPEHVLAIRGNHDVITALPRPAQDLHLKFVEIDGIRFGGFSGSWKYKHRGHHMYEQDEAIKLLKDFPAVDVFIAHNSPRSIHERDSTVHQGFDAFLDYIDRVKPRYFLHGHQHLNVTSWRGDTQIVGVYGERLLSINTIGRLP